MESDSPENVEDIDNENLYADDDYLIELHRKFTEMKNQRKQAERDVSLLDGRVKCLRNEDDKIRKNIEVTRKKTEKKKMTIEQMDAERRMKEEHRERKEKELAELKERNKKMLEQKRLEQAMRREEKMRELQEQAQNHKEQRKNLEEIVKSNKMEDQSNCKTKADYIKSQQQIAEEKKRAYELEKKYQLKCEMERKILEENEKKLAAEQRKKELEEEEIDIMKRLKTTTQTHQMSKLFLFILFSG